jgi:hypothetical protein
MNTQTSSAYSNHDDVWSLLPWYANGSLQGPERDRVKAHVQVCLVCRRELAGQATLAKHLEQAAGVEISYKPSFERLMSRIHKEEGRKSRANGNNRTQGPARWLTRWKNLLNSHFSARHLAAAVATGLLGIALVLLVDGTPADGIKTYHTVADSGSLDRFDANDIRVVFAEQVSEQEIGKLVGSVHGSLMDGPNPAGAYTVRIADDEGKGAPLALALSQLRGNKAIVFVEPAQPRPTGKPAGGGG